MNKKGFINIVVMIILVLGVAGYVVYTKQSPSTNTSSDDTKITCNPSLKPINIGEQSGYLKYGECIYFYVPFNGENPAPELQIVGADPLTFKALDFGCAEDKNYFYKHGDRLADRKDVTSLASGYMKIASNIYYFCTKIDGADIGTFEPIPDIPYAKDKNNFYLMGEILEGIDLRFFTALNPKYLNDKNVPWYRNILYKGIRGKSVAIGVNIPNFDLPTLRDINVYYYRDKNNVYRVYIYPDKTKLLELIEGVSPASVRVLDERYLVDKNVLYYMPGEAPRYVKVPIMENSSIAWADFQLVGNIDGKHYFRDKYNVYVRDIDGNPDKSKVRVLKNVDPTSFAVVGEFIKDKNALYFDYEQGPVAIDIPGFDLQTFQTYRPIGNFRYQIYYKDRNNVYIHRRGSSLLVFEKADPATLDDIGGGYYRDKNNIYTQVGVLENVDLATFKIVDPQCGFGGIFAKDKNTLFYFGKPLVVNIPGFDLQTFQFVGGRYFKDKNKVYYNNDEKNTLEVLKDVDPITFTNNDSCHYLEGPISE